jgi:hypothetical protein
MPNKILLAVLCSVMGFTQLKDGNWSGVREIFYFFAGDMDNMD